MFEVDYKVTGLAELEQKLVALGAATGVKTLAAVTRRAMKPVLDDARALAPQPGRNKYATGLLRDSIRIATVKPTGGDTVAAAGLTTFGKTDWAQAGDDATIVTRQKINAPHWHFIELGVPARGLPAQPFMRPAFYKNTSRMLAIVSGDLKKTIERVAKRVGPLPPSLSEASP